MKSKRVQLSGGISNMTVAEMQAPFEGILRKIGAAGVEIMRQKTRPHDDTGDLTNSMMWITDKGKSDGGVELDPPGNVNEVDMGSALDYAYFREWGSGPHTTSNRSDEFIASLKDWCRSRLGFEPDTPENYGRFKAILRHIRENGTAAEPFAVNSKDEIMMEGLKLGKLGLVEFWNYRKGKGSWT